MIKLLRLKFEVETSTIEASIYLLWNLFLSKEKLSNSQFPLSAIIKIRLELRNISLLIKVKYKVKYQLQFVVKKNYKNCPINN